MSKVSPAKNAKSPKKDSNKKAPIVASVVPAFVPTENHLKLLHLVAQCTFPQHSKEGDGRTMWIRKVPLLVLIYEGMHQRMRTAVTPSQG